MLTYKYSHSSIETESISMYVHVHTCIQLNTAYVLRSVVGTLSRMLLSLPNRYGRDAGSYPRALEASQHYWNTCQGLVQSPMDREPLQQPLKELLAILTSFLPKRGQPADKVCTSVDLAPYIYAGLDSGSC